MLILTGGAGFIGSVTLRYLNDRGYNDIIVVDNLGTSEKWRNLVKCRYVDYMDKREFLEKVKQDNLPFSIDAVVHLGACSSTTESDASYLMENNFHYSREVCRFALNKGARFINASSAATYGAGENGFSDSVKNTRKLRPLNMYGYSKQLFDLWLLRNGFENQVASLKFFNVYGPNEYHKGSMRSVAVKLFEQINAYGGVELFASTDPHLKNGEQKRDFVYVKDCARLIVWLLEAGAGVNGILNVGTGRATSFNALAESMFAALKKTVNIRYIAMPENIAPNYQNYTQADMAWLDKVKLPFKFTDINEGISDYARNYLAKSDIYL